MRVEDPDLLRSMRGPGNCEWCGNRCQTRETAHIFATGLGGGHRCDIALNVVGLGLGGWAFVPPECNCHSLHHAGRNPTKRQLLERAAKREGVDPDDAESVIYLLARLPKHPSAKDILGELDDLRPSERALAVKVLREIRKYLPEQTWLDLQQELRAA